MSGEGQTPEGQCAIGGIQDDVKDGKTAAVQEYRTQNTTPLQVLVGVRVVASLLGHSRLVTLCSRAKA